MLPAKRRFTLKTYLNNFLERKENMDSKITVLCYERCTTCKKALKWLEENNIPYEVRPIKEQKANKRRIDRMVLCKQAFQSKNSSIPAEIFIKNKSSKEKTSNNEHRRSVGIACNRWYAGETSACYITKWNINWI